MNDVRSQRGQATVLTLVFITALLGMAALVLDVGSWFRAQRETQSAADAAALAAAQALPESPGQAGALAASYVQKNGAGTATVTFSTKNFANDTVKVHVARDSPGVFAKLFGVDSVSVGANAVARSGGLASARYAAPIAVDVKHPLLACKPLPCNDPTELDLEKVGPGAFRLLNIDGSRGGTGQKILAGWMLSGYDGYMPVNRNYFSDSGAKFNSSDMKAALDLRIGDEVLFPVYDKVTGGGSNLEYHVIGWVGFIVSSFSGNGSKGIVRGSFVRVIWEGIQGASGSTNDFGVRAIELVE